MSAGTIGRLVGGFLGFGLICTACGGSARTTTKPKDDAGPTFCVPGAERCDGHDIVRCDEQGERELIAQSCLSAECQVRDGTPVCTKTQCTAGSATCDGTVATQCKADGSGPEPGGLDCAKSDQYCVDGTCHDRLCTANAKSCKGGDVYLCAPDGRSFSLSETCTNNEVCDGESATCVARSCTPNQSTCNGTRVSTCNSSGTDWLPNTVDCADQDLACFAGACRKRDCIPSTTFCQDESVYQCDPTGASSSLSKACRPGYEHCEVTPAGLYAFCVANPCIAGQQLCDGDVIKVCDADGSLPTAGTYCKKDEFCEDAQCKPRGCVLNSVFCKHNGVYTCEPTGPSLFQQCDSTTECVSVIPDLQSTTELHAPLASCVPFACPPGQTGCAANQIGTCDSDGNVATVTTDCAAAGQVCTSTGACAANVTETIGHDETKVVLSGSSPYVADVVDVRSARRLTMLQAWLAVPAPSDVRWIVYEQVDNQFLLRADKTTSVASSTAGFVSSGPLNYRLEAGKRYALGVSVPTGSVAFISDTPWLAALSLGPAIGSVSNPSDPASFDISSQYSPYDVWYMTLTTEAP